MASQADCGCFDEPFGDTVDVDLLPEAAIDTITIRDGSPVTDSTRWVAPLWSHQDRALLSGLLDHQRRR